MQRIETPEGAGRWLLPMGLLGVLGAAELLVVQAAGPAIAFPEVSNAVVLDLAVIGPLLFWWFGVRRRGLPRIAVLPVFLAGLGLAHVLVGSQDPAVLGGLEWAAAAAELGLLGLVFRGVGRGLRALGREGGDPLEVIAARVEAALGTGIAGRVVASELAALWFATAGWLRRPPEYGGAHSFRYGLGAGAVYAAILGIAAAEVVAVHLLVARWSVAAAWVLSALAVYGVLYILADLRAVRLRPITLDARTLTVRTGLRWTLEVPRTAIVAAGRRDWRETVGRGGDTLNLALIGQPDVLLELDGEATARGPFGIVRTASRIGISVDDPEAFLNAVEGDGSPETAAPARPRDPS